MFVVLLGSYASAQEFSVQAGSFLNEKHIHSLSEGDVIEGDDQAFMGYGEFSADLIKGGFRLAPVAKIFFYDGSLSSAINSEDNNYGFSGGLEAGFDFKGGMFAIGFELPIPDQRDAIFEAVISPSLTLVKEGGLGVKINYDYFINQKLFQYNGAISAGLVYKF